jgi:predicted unusual protein kinase regulating ubiquinone biosynthesis (AarF/ABC1/UbiB family)
VVVKVQYPGVDAAIEADLASIDRMGGMVGMVNKAVDVPSLLGELRARLVEELDYRREARNQELFRHLWAGHPMIRVPRVYPSHSRKRVLTSAYVRGFTFYEFLKHADPRERRIASASIADFVFDSMFVHLVYNGDPHPGNYLFDAEGRMVFLDFGCVKYFPVEMLERWKRFVKAHLEGDAQRFYELTLEFGFIKRDAGISPQLLYRYFDYFYAPFQRDRVFRFDRKYTAQSVRIVFRPEGEFAGIQAKLNMPRDFVFANRLQWGVYSVLAELGAEQNFHRIHREFIYGDPPSTELGEQEQLHWQRFRAARGLPETADLLLRPDTGVTLRHAPAAA